MPLRDPRRGLGVAQARIEREVAVFERQFPERKVETGLRQGKSAGHSVDPVEQTGAIRRYQGGNVILAKQAFDFILLDRARDKNIARPHDGEIVDASPEDNDTRRIVDFLEGAAERHDHSVGARVAEGRNHGQGPTPRVRKGRKGRKGSRLD